MYFYKHCFADWQANCAAMTPLESFIFQKMFCVLVEHKVLPLDKTRLLRLLRVLDADAPDANNLMRDALDSLLSNYFTADDKTYSNTFFDSILQEYKSKEDMQKARTAKATEARRNVTITSRQRNVVQNLESRIKNIDIYPPTPQEGGDAGDDAQGVNVRVSRKSSKAGNPNDCPEGVEPQTWADYLTVRKAKKAPMTHTALAKMQSEANKANMSLQSVIAMCAERNWQGFSASWEHEKRDRQAAATEDRSQSYRKNNRDNQATAILSQATQSVRSPAADDDNPYRSYVPSYLRPENVPSARKIDTVDDNSAKKPKTKLALLAERAARELPPKDTAITEQENQLITILTEKTEALGIKS
jgi:hypothetical protein